MDDVNLTEQLTGTRTKTPFEEAWHKEQERRKYDIIRVKNPTNKDYYVKYDINQFQRIPANSTIDIPRYIATRYLTHMKDLIIHDIGQKKHDAAIEERKEKGQTTFKSKWEENEETYLSSDYPRTNDPVVMTPIFQELWVGLVYEFGKDTPPGNADPRAGEVDLTPVEVKILEGLEKKRVAPDGQVAQVIKEDFNPPSTQTQGPPSQVPQSEFIPQAPAVDFSALNEVLDKKLTPEEISE